MKKQIESKQTMPKQKHGGPLIISFFLPGVGQLAKGQILHAIAVWGLYFIAFLIMISGAFIIGFLVAVFAYVYNLYDAYNS